MKKVLLLSCFICLTAQAGTGGGTSTPPGRAGLAKLLAEVIGFDGNLFRMSGTEPLPQEIELVADPVKGPVVDQVTHVEVSNENGESRSYRVMDGKETDQIVLKDRRLLIRASILRQP